MISVEDCDEPILHVVVYMIIYIKHCFLIVKLRVYDLYFILHTFMEVKLQVPQCFQRAARGQCCLSAGVSTLQRQ